METVTQTKYYVPTIEEFHIGFEYQKQIHTKEWVDVFYDELDKNTKYDIEKALIRVKHLDREDIESLGFVFKHSGKHSKLISFRSDLEDLRGEKVGIILNYVTNWCLIFTKEPDLPLANHIKPNETGQTLFCGFIKNKSELKRVLIQLGILQTD